MKVHKRCPNCDTLGQTVEGQDSETLVCRESGCRVFTYAKYYG